MENKKENIEELMRKFLGAEEGRKAAGEIGQVEQLFDSNPAPEPGEQLIENIRGQVSERLSKPRAVRRGYQVAVVAAAVIVWGWVAVQFFESSRPEMERTVAVDTTSTTASTDMVASLDRQPAEDIWSDLDDSEVDAEITIINEEIESIEGAIFALRLGDEQDIENGEILADVEFEIVEVDNSFWKG